MPSAGLPKDSYNPEIIFMEALTHSQQPPNSSSIDQDRHDAIRRRAEEIYIRNGRIPGRDIQNWIQAEREILSETAEHSDRSAVVIEVSGIRYVGEYSVETADGYAPGEFAAGDPVTVRFDGDRMFVKRNNGDVLQTTIVKRIS